MHYEDRRTTYHSSSREPLCHTWNCFIGTTGALQVIIGIVSIIFGTVVVLEEYGTDKSPIGMPIWAGALFLLTGLVGLANLCIRKRAMITTYMIMCILACILAVVQIIWESIAASYHQDEYETCSYPYDGSSWDCFDRLAEFMHIAAAVIAGVEIIVATCGWIFAMRRSGCDCFPQQEQVVVVHQRRHRHLHRHNHRPPPPRPDYYVDTSKIFIP
ncbi:uncharacterized protein [Amphiura filiformis]|uniref:uncharacterized protein n=1 Tax=Amphiura filiformis TaxID=82378 RepID=UPI003B226CA1